MSVRMPRIKEEGVSNVQQIIRKYKFGFFVESALSLWQGAIIFVSTLLLSISWLSTSGLAQEMHIKGTPFITPHKSELYSTSGANKNLEQGAAGKMLFTNDYGVLSLTSNNWSRYPRPFNKSEIRASLLHDHKLFIGGTSEFGYFDFSKKSAESYVVLDPTLLNPSFKFTNIHYIIENEDHIYFISDNGVIEFWNNKLTILGEGIDFRYATKNSSTVYFASYDQGVYRLENGKISQLELNEETKKFLTTFVLGIGNDQLLVGTRNQGILLYENNKFRIWNERNNFRYKNINLIKAIVYDQELLAFGSLGYGLILTNYQGEIQSMYNESNGLGNNEIQCILKDSKSNIWITSDGPPSYIEINSPFRLINKTSGLRGAVYAIHLTEKLLYVGTSSGLYVANNDETQMHQAEFELVKGTVGRTYQILEHQGNLLLAHQSGVYQINETSIKLICEKAAINLSEIPDHPNLLLAGDNRGMCLFRLTKDGYEFSHKLKGYEGSAREFMFDAEHQLWMSHGYEGIYKIDLSAQLDSIVNLQLYDDQKGLPSNQYNNLIKFRDAILFGTEKGIFEYDMASDSMVPNNYFSDIVGNNTLVRKFVEIDNDKFVSLTNYPAKDQSAFIDLFSDGTHSITDEPFRRLKGELIAGSETIISAENDKLLLGTRSGLVIYDQNYKSQVPLTHTCFLDKVTVLPSDSILYQELVNEPQTQKIKFNIPPNQSIRFSFSSSSYDALQYITYSTYMEGLDNEWTEWTTEEHREFINLESGDYIFWVKSRNIYNIESPLKSLKFHLTSNSYQYSYMSFMIGFSLLLFFAVCTFLLTLWNRKQQRRIEDLDQTLSLTSHAKNSLKESYKTLEEQNKKIDQRLSSSLLLNDVQDIALQKVEIIVKRDKNKVAENVLAEYRNNKKNIYNHSEWLNNQLITEFASKLKDDYPSLTHKEIKLCCYLRMNLSSRELTEYLDISLRGVESLRYRVRKKLHLVKETSLTDFLTGL